jgi:glutaminyl-tRNA synthetase
MIGIAKANSSVDIDKLEYCIREDLNKNAPRVLGVLRPIEVELTNWSGGTEQLDAPYFPPDVGKPGTRAVPFSGRILIDRDDWHDDPPKDYKRLGPGRTVRLRYGYCITADEVIERDAAGNAIKLRATVHLETKGGKNPDDGKKVSGVIHWVDAATSVPVEVRLYEQLFKVPKPEEGGQDFLDHINPNSLEVVRGARVEASLAAAEVGARFQLERVGYFVVDLDSKPGALVLNRTITLRESAKTAVAHVQATAGVSVSASGTVSQPKNPKAQSRPKTKSPAEQRAEARARDAELASAFTTFSERLGESNADLLTGDRETLGVFRTLAAASSDELAAKWIINELPRVLGDKPIESIATGEVGQLFAALQAGTIAPTAGKKALAAIVAGGKSFAAAQADLAAPAIDLGAAVDAVIAANPEKAAEYRAGKKGLIGFFIGEVMKSTPNADAKTVNQTVRERLA